VLFRVRNVYESVHHYIYIILYFKLTIGVALNYFSSCFSISYLYFVFFGSHLPLDESNREVKIMSLNG
jgi:hypothetical protein